MYKIIDFFTTQDGSWNPDNREFSIRPDIANKYAADDFPERGCATCLFAKIVGGPANTVLFKTDGGLEEKRTVSAGGWANLPIFKSSAYNPAIGEQGPWSIEVLGAPSERLEGVGLPYSWHVSSFAVFAWEEGTVEPQPAPSPQVPDLPEGPQVPDLPQEPSVEIPNVQLYVQGRDISLFVDGKVVYQSQGSKDMSL